MEERRRRYHRDGDGDDQRNDERDQRLLHARVLVPLGRDESFHEERDSGREQQQKRQPIEVGRHDGQEPIRADQRDHEHRGGADDPPRNRVRDSGEDERNEQRAHVKPPSGVPTMGDG